MNTRKIDCSDDICPMPLIKAIQELRTMNSKEILILHANRSCVSINIKDWAEKNGYELTIIKTAEEEWDISIKKP